MNNRKLLILCVIALMVFSTIAPSAGYDVNAVKPPAGASNLTIKNLSMGTVSITLTGPQTYYIDAPVGTSTLIIKKGVYTATYNACGSNLKATVKANGAQSKLNIAKCKTTILVIDNYSSEYLTMSMSGPQILDITVNPRTRYAVRVLSGTYHIIAVCGGRTYNVTWNIKGNAFRIYCRG